MTVQVITAASMKTDGGHSTYLCNVDLHRDYTALYRTMLYSSQVIFSLFCCWHKRIPPASSHILFQLYIPHCRKFRVICVTKSGPSIWSIFAATRFSHFLKSYCSRRNLFWKIILQIMHLTSLSRRILVRLTILLSYSLHYVLHCHWLLRAKYPP